MSKARDLTRALEELDPSSIEADGDWIFYSRLRTQHQPKSLATDSQTRRTVRLNINSCAKSGLKSVKIPFFDENADKWPYFGGIFSSLVDKNYALSPEVKLAHLSGCLSDKAREVIACLTGEPGDYERAEQLTVRDGDPWRCILATNKFLDEWVRQLDSEAYAEDVKGLALWAQAKAKTLRKRERADTNSHGQKGAWVP